MKFILRVILGLAVVLTPLAWFSTAEAVGTEPLVSVELTNDLGSKSSITIHPSALYRIKDQDITLQANKDYEVKIAGAGVSLYQAKEKIGEFSRFEVIPSTYDATLSINGQPYLGNMLFKNENNKYVRPVNTLPMEDYLKGVIPREVYTSWELDTFKSQAIAARSYVLSLHGKLINDSTRYQVYGGYNWNARTSQAVDETFGQVITYKGSTVNAVYSSSNGGIIESNTNFWDTPVNTYSQVKDDPYDPQRIWTKTVQKQQINLSEKDLKKPEQWWDTTKEADKTMTDRIKSEMLKKDLTGKDIKITSISKVNFYEPTSGKRVTKGDLSVKYIAKNEFDKDGQIVEKQWDLTGSLAEDVIRLIDGSSMLSKYVTDIKDNGTSIVITGKGFGHGIGLSQFGANSMAKQGKNYQEILAFYYPTTLLTSAYDTAYPRVYKVLPNAPEVNDITSEDTKVTGKAAPGSIVYVKKGSTLLGRSTVSSQGTYSVSIQPQAAKTKIGVVIKDSVGYSAYTYKTVVQKVTKPEAPTINKIYDQDTSVSGTAEANSIVYVKKGSTVLGRGVATKQGTYSIGVTPQAANSKLGVTVKNGAGYSSYTYMTVSKTVQKPAAPVIHTVTDQDISVSGTAEANSIVYVKKGSTVLGRGVATKQGSYNIAIAPQPANTKLGVTVKNSAGYSAYTYSTVAAKYKAPNAPAVNDMTDESTAVTGTTEARSRVYVKAGTNVIGTGTANSKGAFSITIPKQSVNTKIGVTAKGKGGYSPYTYKIVLSSGPSAPNVNRVRSMATTVTGITEAKSIVYIKKESELIGRAVADSKGTFNVAIKPQAAKTKISITIKNPKGKYSPYRILTVG
ncbi:Ig-like domain-containing protein [Priestia aryabhattai]|uniref:Ig-like domain-containing protein n=1 Tax=Priestia aryabhattai TaxID=412384 RepID=UPI0023802B04|nr:Ig-like domain-containing protein [Priestia aryabhattai]WDW10064.1 Ig-like domain-containing protein [Priestia aryabhattai]